MLGAPVSHAIVTSDAAVTAVMPICRDHVRVEAALTGFPASQPGQFLQLRCGDDVEFCARAVDWVGDEIPSLSCGRWGDEQPLLRRPFSIADRWEDDRGQTGLVVISRTVGKGTRWLSGLRVGDKLGLTGPLGRGFVIPSVSTPIVLVGGGVGIPPLLYLSRRLHAVGHRDVTVIFGAVSRELLPVRLIAEPRADGAPGACVELPGGACFPASVTSDDGTVGMRGLVTDALRLWQDGHAGDGPRGCVFACGPELMLRAVARLTRAAGLDCQLCVERQMGCGLGTCLSCVVRVRDAAHETGWRWALACTDGPVFWRDELVDEDAPVPE